MQLSFQSYAPPIETPRNSLQIITFSDVQAQAWVRFFFAKTYGDYKRLHDFIMSSDVQTDFE